MFGLSTWEILIILAVALIFVGPDQLPKVARKIGQGVRQVRGAVGKVDDEMRRAMREAAAQIDDDGNPIGPQHAPAPPPSNVEGDAPPGALTPPPAAAAANGASAPASGTTPAAPPAASAPPAHLARDWSQVGKIAPPGRVASAAPARPTTAAPSGAPAVSPSATTDATAANRTPTDAPAPDAAADAGAPHTPIDPATTT